MKDNNAFHTNTIDITTIPFLKDYGEVKKRLSIRLNNKARLLATRPGVVYEPFLDFAVTCHIEVGDLVGSAATCVVEKWLMEYIGVGQERLFADAKENGAKTRPGVIMPIESYIGWLGFLDEEPKSGLMIATNEDCKYGAGVVLYTGFLDQISCGKNIFLIPSSIHEWLYFEDRGEYSKDELVNLHLRVIREAMFEEETLSEAVYYYDWRQREMRRA